MDTEFRFMPEQASSFASEVDALYAFLLMVGGVMSVGIATTIVYFAIKYRRGSRADRTQGAGHVFLIELSWILIPFAFMMVMFVWGARLYFAEIRPPENVLEITCVARQWMWKFQHPEGHSEINDLHLPLGQAVRVKMISEDVIHSLYIPAFRVKQDVLPGRYSSLWFEPTKLGEYHLFCAEYCGAKHAEMRGTVHVLEPSQYQAWLSGGPAAASPVEAGRQLFEQLRCDTCHKEPGVVARGPSLDDLVGRKVTLTGGESVTADAAYLRESILRPAAKLVAGYQPIMPSFEGQVGEEGLLHLIAYLNSRTLAKAHQPETAAPERTVPEP